MPIAAATLAAFCLVATPAAAQDVPWGHKSDTKKPAKKADPKKAPAKKAAKAPSNKAPAKKVPPKAATPPTKKAAAPENKEPVAPAKVDPEAKPKVELVKVNLLDHFEKELTPHGKWLTDEEHGKVWIPNPATVGKEWAPYRDHGHWALTDKDQWAWVSDMKWGKIPFHYGRWAWSPKKNWMWVPGTDHAPAWVVWRVADANRKFVGWAPMAPEAKGDTKTPLPYYFAPTRYLFSPHLDKFVIANPRLAKKMHAHSHVFGGHTPAVAPPATAKSGKQATTPVAVPVPESSDWLAATPTFKDVSVPAYALPKTKLGTDNEAIAPVLGLITPVVDETASVPAAGPEESRFATPPPPEKTATKRAKKRSHRARSRANRSWKKNQPRYRCWWTNTRPRIWRCGY